MKKKKALKKIKPNKLKNRSKAVKNVIKVYKTKTKKIKPVKKKVIFASKKECTTSFSERLKSLRSGSGISEKTLQSMTGINHRRVTALEVGELKPTDTEISILSKAFGTTFDFLLYGT
jgi:ribosome-binding protein aMBF1 (putative translation factor)